MAREVRIGSIINKWLTCLTVGSLDLGPPYRGPDTRRRDDQGRRAGHGRLGCSRRGQQPRRAHLLTGDSAVQLLHLQLGGQYR